MLWIACVGLCPPLAALVVIRTQAAQDDSQIGSRQPAEPAVPVVVARAARQDVPVYAEGVGMVQAYQAVLVRSRVDGTLVDFPVTEGREVKRGEVIAVIDPRPFQAVLDQAMAKKAQDEAQLANARLDLARFAPLVRPGFASRQQYDTQQALVSQFVAAVAGDIASIQTAQLNLSFCFITSPVDGRVGLRLVDPGNVIHANDADGIVSITQIHPISMTFTLAQEELPQIEANVASAAAHGLRVLAYATDDRTLLGEGTLLTPDNTINVSTGTIVLKATFPNTDNRLWPGQFINAHLQLGTAKNAVTIPPEAIEHGPDGLFVYVVKPDSPAAVQPVSIGYQTSALAVATSGLNGGETVVVDGQSRLQAGTRVSAKVTHPAN
jgi:multidrug efflux system membrane fusion protein